MTTKLKYILKAASLGGFMSVLAVNTANAVVNVQCPGDLDGSAEWTVSQVNGAETQPANTKCLHLGGGDGYVKMGDGTVRYMFGFSDLSGIPTNPAPADPTQTVMSKGMLAAASPAPAIELDEGDEFYLTLTNVGMTIRPDLFDPHTVHYHGFPQASPIFDGLPDSGISINMGSSLTYYYKVNDPGTYMYHCHVEAAEHMQMGMVGNLYVHPAQDGDSYVYNGKTYTTFAYNDGDGSTGYDADYPIQIGSFDSAFHDASEAVQPLPFALMADNFPMLNGRGYPDTINPGNLGFLAENGGDVISQSESSLITANPGDRVLLRLSNLNVTRTYTLGTMGIVMTVVGKDAKLLRGLAPDFHDLYYQTNSVTIGPGESYDAILDIPAGSSGDTYFLYTTNLNYLVNDNDDALGLGGMMTEIRVN